MDMCTFQLLTGLETILKPGPVLQKHGASSSERSTFHVVRIVQHWGCPEASAIMAPICGAIQHRNR